jgi:phage terminase large subunit-like protein
MQRFNLVVPWFKAGKMYFPEDLKHEPFMQETMAELSLAASSGFRSKHDDVIDTISQLASLVTWRPDQEGKVNDASGIWELEEDDNEYDDQLSSYII